MTLHEAIEKLLQQTRQSMTTQEIADSINKNQWYQKKDGSKITNFQIYRRTNNYPQLFNRNGTTISLAKHRQTNLAKPQIVSKGGIKVAILETKDEHYVINLCDKILQQTSSRQHKFDFLLGDANAKGITVKLPVDAYYQELNLVVEYRERQHTERVTFFDKPNKMTVSGINRGEQRKKYDERRELIPRNGLTLVEISYSDFSYNIQKRIIRNELQDTEMIKKILRSFIDKT